MKKILTVFLLVFSGSAILVFVIGSTSSPYSSQPNASATSDPGRFDPRRYGIPEYIAGYKVWAVAALACSKPGELTVYVQVGPSPFPTPPVGSLTLLEEMQHLREQLKIPLGLATTSSIMPMDVFSQHIDRWNTLNANGCIQLGGPMEIATTNTPFPR